VTRDIDVLVIGGGPAGYVAAIRLGQLGRQALVVEREHLGGECLNRGCIPSKALIHASELLHQVRSQGPEMGFEFLDLKSNLGTLKKWKDAVVERERQGVATLLRAAGAQWVQGRATLTGPETAEIPAGPGSAETESVRFRAAVLATGSVPLSLKGFEPDGKRVLTAREMLDLDRRPDRLLVLGGGVSGVELGQHFARLGSRVTIVELLPDILPGVEPDLVRELRRRLEGMGVQVLSGTRAVGLTRGESTLALEVLGPQGDRSVLEGDVLFVTVGKRPATSELGLEAAGVQVDGKTGFVKVDGRMATNVPNIFAAGDLAGPPMLAHKAYREGIVAAEAIAGRPTRWDHQVIPWVIFTDPELASAGLTLAQAREAGLKAREVRFSYAALGRAHASHATGGFVKLVAEEGTERILGLHAAGERSGEFISEAALAIEMGAQVRDLAATIHPHPTFAESLAETALLWLGEPMHMARAPSHGTPRP